MIVFALLLAMAASRLLVVDELFRVPPSEAKLVNLSLRQRPAVVEVAFDVVEGDDVRVALMGRGDGEQSRRGAPHQTLTALPFQRSGKFRYPARTLGEYQVLLDNRGRGRGAIAVRLQVSLMFGEAGAAEPGVVSPVRKTAVIVLSLLFLVAVGLWPGRELLGAMQKRRRGEPPPLFF